LAALGLDKKQERKLEAAQLQQEGRELYELARFHEAILAYQRARRLWQAVGSPEQVAQVVHELGMTYYGAERYADALQAYGETLRLYRRIGNREMEARVLYHMGMA
jgi:tetratricopeptide (TPR) repeat protein